MTESRRPYPGRPYPALNVRIAPFVVQSVQFGWRVQLPRFRVGIITTGVFGSEGTERRAQITYSEVFK